jgi:hypothetical protein
MVAFYSQKHEKPLKSRTLSINEASADADMKHSLRSYEAARSAMKRSANKSP